MCGIVGLFGKSSAITDSLGAHLAEMLVQLGDRGPDSAGVAFYRDPAPAGACKVSLFSPDPAIDWAAVAADLGEAFGSATDPEVRATHAVIVVDTDAPSAQDWLRENRPDLRIMSAGERALPPGRTGGPPRPPPHRGGRGEKGGPPGPPPFPHPPSPSPPPRPP